MSVAIIDYGSGNLRSAEKSFQRVAAHPEQICVTRDPDRVASADRIVLPGVGAFADCKSGLTAHAGLFEAIEEAVLNRGVPFLGICVGMQMMASWGREHGDTPGLDWIAGEVLAIRPTDPTLKVPHMGWNTLQISRPHPVFDQIEDGNHGYFVHSFHLECEAPEHVIATASYGGAITAAIGKDNMVGTQFHPEKSQKTGLRLIENFLNWRP